MSLFGPAQGSFPDGFVFVRSYLKPVDVDAFVEYCTECAGLEFKPEELGGCENSPKEETHKTKAQKQKAEAEQQKSGQKQPQSTKKDAPVPLAELLAQP